MTNKPSSTFIRTILLYGLALGGGLVLLKLLEFDLVMKKNVFEVYAGIVAVLFCVVGIWVGVKLSDKTKKISVEEPTDNDWPVNDEVLKELGISKRELEVLRLIAKGHTNKEIADALFVSPNTIKTHLTNIFSKLDVNRRTQAIQRAKELNVLP